MIVPEWNVHKMLKRIKGLEFRLFQVEDKVGLVEPDQVYCLICGREIVLRTTDGARYCESCGEGQVVPLSFDSESHVLTNKELEDAIDQARSLARDKHSGIGQAGLDTLNELLDIQVKRAARANAPPSLCVRCGEEVNSTGELGLCEDCKEWIPCVGDKVTYEPFIYNADDAKDAPPPQHGIVKEYRPEQPDVAWIVFNCCDDYDSFMDYTGQQTKLRDVRRGWL